MSLRVAIKRSETTNNTVNYTEYNSDDDINGYVVNVDVTQPTTNKRKTIHKKQVNSSDTVNGNKINNKSNKKQKTIHHNNSNTNKKLDVNSIFELAYKSLWCNGTSPAIEFLTDKQLDYIKKQKAYKLSTGNIYYRGEWKGNSASGIGEKLVVLHNNNNSYRRHIGYFIDAKSSNISCIEDNNTLYIGECKDDLEHGQGHMIYKLTKHIITGEFEHGLPVSGTLQLGDKTEFYGTFDATGQPKHGKYLYGKSTATLTGMVSYEGDIQGGGM